MGKFKKQYPELNEVQKQFVAEHTGKYSRRRMAAILEVERGSIRAYQMSAGLIKMKVHSTQAQNDVVNEMWTPVNVKARLAALRPPEQPYIFQTKRLPWI